MGMAMQEDDTITQHGRAFRRMASRWPSDYFLFPKLKEHSSGQRCEASCDPSLRNDLVHQQPHPQHPLFHPDIGRQRPGRERNQQPSGGLNGRRRF
ncbi:hypothetical protein AVEN_183373-1 [Araneus ventricosus]|uniref:Uncharacterized protein n=1 Tax=Araneus ventricosus TaxID=182803 RepID=A0A4Y2UM58_ARAVE|nr:hypothetical protein AVEN_35052-1 [Araneus ventricosus]GBO14128.1 hypothetical protein AVEN_183373-1 [Araneus ventricosus]